jgi:hypothetical protein
MESASISSLAAGCCLLAVAGGVACGRLDFLRFDLCAR